MKPSDPIPRSPDLYGSKSQAWRCNIGKMAQSLGVVNENNPTISWWLVEAPWAHPIWHSYLITLANLRPMVGVPNAVMYFPKATHEITVHALEPHGRRELMITGEASIGKGSVQVLVPTNFAAQFVEPTDAAADLRVKEAVQMICDGTLSPDTDFTHQWVELFGGNMIIGRPKIQ